MFVLITDQTQQGNGAIDCSIEGWARKVQRQNPIGRKRNRKENYCYQPFEQANRPCQGVEGIGLGSSTYDIDKRNPNAKHPPLVYKELGKTQIFMTGPFARLMDLFIFIYSYQSSLSFFSI